MISDSKPGAAPVATWVSHEVIGLHEKGYGALLGEAVFSCVKVTLAMLQFCDQGSYRCFSDVCLPGDDVDRHH